MVAQCPNQKPEPHVADMTNLARQNFAEGNHHAAQTAALISIAESLEWLASMAEPASCGPDPEDDLRRIAADLEVALAPSS